MGNYTQNDVLQTLVEHWDGTSWSIVPSPSVGPWSTLVQLAPLTPDDIWAVGGYSDNAPLGMLVEHWDGTAWTVALSSTTEGPGTSIAALPSGDVWVSGYSLDDGSTLIMHRDGTLWTRSSSPSQNGNNSLDGIIALPSGDIWAVGSYENSQFETKTLIEHASPCGGATVTPTTTPVPGSSPSPSATVPAPPSTSTLTVTSTATARPTSTPEPCSIAFTDVAASDYFYEAVRYLYCAGAISGYSDNTFRPYSNTTRGQLSKIVVLAEGWTLNTTGGPHFSDVLTGNPFYPFIETAYNRQVISGYADGTFRWGNPVTRAQLAKIVVLARGWPLTTMGGPHFSDVPAGDPFYSYIETAYNHTVISGYSNGLFLPGNNATRGQIAKIVFSALTSP